MKKCNHPPGNDFGSVAVAAAVLLRTPEARSYSPGAAQSFSATPTLLAHPRAPRREHPRAHRRGRACRDPSYSFVRSCGRTPGLQTIVTVELQLGVRAAGSAS